MTSLSSGLVPVESFSAYELIKLKPELKIGIFETGGPLEKENVQLTERKLSPASIVRLVPS